MKYLKTLLIFVLAFIVWSTNYAASAVNVPYSSSEMGYSIPKNKLKKDRMSKKQRAKKLLTTGDGTGFNIASFVLGLVGLSLCWLPYFGLLLCVGAIVLGGMGLKKKLRGLGIAGLVMGIVGIIPAVIITLLFASI